MVNKKGQGIVEIQHILIALVVLVILAGAAILLYKGKGGAILDQIQNIFRFGR